MFELLPPSSLSICDENATVRGKIDIEHWIVTIIDKYKFKFKPLNSQERDNETIVSVEVSGTFPGSPTSLDCHFVIANGKIESLTIDSWLAQPPRSQRNLSCFGRAGLHIASSGVCRLSSVATRIGLEISKGGIRISF